MDKKKILLVVGTRPNFIKVTQFKRVAENYPNLELKIAHTGQHSDATMAQVFFDQFGLRPDFYLDIDSSSPLTQMGQILFKLEALIKENFPANLIITPGDVNSTLAVAIVANKLGISLAHLESGLRSNDREMPEEINRILTDEISDLFFVTEESGIQNLTIEKKNGQIHFVGNTMIDTLVASKSEIEKSSILEDLNLQEKFVLMTVHRPSNVDSEIGLKKLLALLTEVSKKYMVVFPIHPRTKKNLKRFGLEDQLSQLANVTLTDAMGYFEFQKLVKSCELVITDSGGIQEETTFQGVPCLTVRDNTERPITVQAGTNTLLPFEVEEVMDQVQKIQNGTYKKGEIPELWDGNATERILKICSDYLS